MKHHRTVVAAIAAAAAAAGSLVVMTAPPASALTTVYVDAAGTDGPTCGASDDPCRTIAVGVANVDAGGTVLVAAGTYPGYTDITKAVTITGAGQGATIVGTGGRAGGFTGYFRIRSAGDVTIQDLTIRGSLFGTSGPAYGIYFDSPASTAGRTNTVSDVTFEGAGAGGNDYNIYCEDSNADLVIEGSTFSQADNNPLLVEGCTGKIRIAFNTIEKTTGTAVSSAVFLMNNLGRFGTAGVDIVGNSVTGASISVNTAFQGLAPGGFGPVTIAGNQVTGGGVSVNNQASNAGAAAAVINGTKIQGNLLQGTGAGNGVSITGNVTGTLVETNAISGYATGINHAAAAAGHTPSGTTVVANRIVANTTAASSVVALTAENNWWGCNNLPSCATFVGGGVDSDPNVVLTASATPTSVLPGGSATVTASLATNSAGGATPSTYPNQAPVGFSTSLGTVTPTSAPVTARVASTTVTSATPGVATVTSTHDSQSVTSAVTFTAPPAPPVQQCKLIKITLGIPLLGIKPIVICI